MNEIKDSGARREFSTGAVRDRGHGDEKKFRRYDLLPYHALYRWAMHMGRGAAKYAARNWEAGMPLSEFYNSAFDHLTKAAQGYTDEDHIAAALWNVACVAEGQDRIRRGLWPKEFDDLGNRIFNGIDPAAAAPKNEIGRFVVTGVSVPNKPSRFPDEGIAKAGEPTPFEPVHDYAETILGQP